MFSQGVKIFASVSCWFKPRLGAGWDPEPVTFATVLDDRNPSARYVTVPLTGCAARSLRCRFHFADVWMMFSEVSFQSEDTVLPTAVLPSLPANQETTLTTPSMTSMTSDLSLGF